MLCLYVIDVSRQLTPESYHFSSRVAQLNKLKHGYMLRMTEPQGDKWKKLHSNEFLELKDTDRSTVQHKLISCTLFCEDRQR
jgi:hypothetical protein